MSQAEKRYFGTDGIRGAVGVHPITAEFALKFGWAIGKVFGRNKPCQVLIGKDTRISGYMFESALQAGLSAAGVDIRLLGPMPTPAIAYLTRTLRAQAGIVISASHNPYADNGFKLFSSEGTKLSDEVEHEIEAALAMPMTTVVAPVRLGKAKRIADAQGRYIEFCKSTIPSSIKFSGKKIVVDCAHGATYMVAPQVFSELGAEVISIGVDPDGENINANCGSTSTQALQAKVLETGADLGVALDGDGDRVIMVDHKGEVVDGDEILFIIARSLQKVSHLKGAVVGTVMTNLGMEHALKDLGIGFKRVSVGDRYVMQMLQQEGWSLGGESSGHIICLDRTTTGDGIVAALQVMAGLEQSNCTLNELKGGMVKYPQCMINVPLSGDVDPMKVDAVQDAIKVAEAELAGDGRVLLRPSGTEPLLRVFVEGMDAELVKRLAANLAEVVKKTQHS